jgi:hypothetical protein
VCLSRLQLDFTPLDGRPAKISRQARESIFRCLFARIRLAVHDGLTIRRTSQPEKPAALTCTQFPLKHLPPSCESSKMHRRSMVRREDNRPIGGAGIAPGLVPRPPLVLILGLISLRVNQKTAADKRKKPNYSEFPKSWPEFSLRPQDCA